jgi:glycosyltransferase involved in cell wall biosynthesis
MSTTLRLVERGSTGTPRRHSVGPRLRVLVLRACRPAQFAAAVADARARHPRAEVVALTHRGHRDSLAAAGVDDVIEIRGGRFGLLRVAPGVIRRLRREGFDEVVVPQMTAHRDGHGNLYRFAAALGAPHVTVIRGDAPPQTYGFSAFRREVLKQVRHDLIGFVQQPALLLGLLAASCVAPRRARRAGERTRVLHIISSLGVGGAQRQLAELVNRTPADRYHVDVLVLGRADGEFSRQWFSREAVSVTYLAEWPRLVSSVFEVRRHCVAGHYDIVHTWLFMANVIGVAGARLAGVPRVIASVRNLSLWKRTWYRQWWLRAADALCSRAADVVTVNAQALAADHGRWALYPPARIDVVHNGLDPSQFAGDLRAARAGVRLAAGLDHDATVIGTVGRLAPEKDHLTFLRLLRQVRAARPEVHGVIVGDGQLRGQLEAAATELGLDGAVTFLGERDDARRLMAGFDVFVLTSTIEGFPNVLLEAAFLGVPAIASRVGGNADVLARLDDTFEAGDAEAAAERVLAFVDTPSLAETRAALNRRRASTMFTADRTAARWFALYDAPSAPTARDQASVRNVRLHHSTFAQGALSMAEGQPDRLSKEALQ